MTPLTRPAHRRLSRWSAALAGTALVAAGLTGVTMTPATAAPGDFDPGFAAAGRYPLGTGFRIVGLDQFADDRFTTVSIRPGDTDSIDVRRFTPAGAADPTFAGDGNLQFGGPASWLGPAVALDRTRGYTYVSAYSEATGLSRVWRFTPAGALDPTWGGLGRVDFPGTRFLDIALQPNGQLVIANAASIYRLTSTGAIDTAFGNSGGATLGTGQIDSLRTLADGDVVAAGRSATSIDVFRLNPGGGIDSRFGSNGKATYRPTPPLGWVTAAIQPVSLGVQNDGAVVVAAGADERNTTTDNHRFPLVVTRFTEKGANDGRFKTKRDYGVEISGKLAIQADDKVIVPITFDGRAALLRLEPDGAQDPTFGDGGGWVDAEADSRPTATLVQRSGRIVVTGFAPGRTGLLWAFQGDRTPKCQGRYATAYGSGASDVIRGTDGPDVLVGGNGKDKIVGGAGSDRICGDEGKDVLVGGNGQDKVLGGGDADVLKGYDGKDLLKGGGGNDRIEGNGAKDKLFGNAGDDRLYGGPDRDQLNGGPGRNLLRQ